MRRRGRQEEQSKEFPDQVSTGRQNPVPEEVDPVVGSTDGLAADNRVEQLIAEIGEIRQEMRTLIGLLVEQRQPRQDQAPLATPSPPRLQAPLEEQQVAPVTDDTCGHVRLRRGRFPRVPIRGRVSRPPKEPRSGCRMRK